jgi:hypothetical protein
VSKRDKYHLKKNRYQGSRALEVTGGGYLSKCSNYLKKMPARCGCAEGPTPKVTGHKCMRASVASVCAFKHQLLAICEKKIKSDQSKDRSLDKPKA